MPRAKAIAAKGMCVRWTDVLKDFSLDERTALKLYATADDVDAIDRICTKARDAVKRSLKS